MLIKLKRAFNQNKRHVFDVLHIVFTSFLSKVVALVVFMYVARVLGGVDFGKYQTLLVTLTLFSSAVQSSVTLYATNFVARGRAQGVDISGVVFTAYVGAGFLGSGAFALVTLTGEWLAIAWLGDKDLQPLLILAGLTLLLNAVLGVQSGVLAGLSLYRKTALLTAIPSVCAAPFFLWFSELMGIKGAVIALVLQSFIACAVGELFIQQAGVRSWAKFRGRVWSKGVGDFAKYSGPTFISGFLIAPANWYATILIVALPDGYIEMAVYGVANQWKQAILFVPTALSSFVTSHLSRRANSSEDYRRVFNFSIASAFFSGLGIAVLICFGSSWILSQYHLSLPLGWLVLCVVSISAAVASVSNMYSRAVASLGRTWLFLGYEVVWASVFVGAAVLLVGEYRALGAALAGLIAALCQLFFQFVTWKYINSRP